jgi:tRNA G18 (ribose-2'-O)-methylase SpoU
MSEHSRSVAFSTEDLRRSKSDRKAFAKMPRLPVTVVLDQVRHAYNIGAIFRLCDANLVASLIVAGTAVNLRNRHLVRAAQGTQHWTPWAQVDAAEVAVARAKADGRQVVVIEQASNSIRLEDFIPTFPVCVVLGGERGGVSPQVLRLADAVIEIPMRGMANSINVATATAIVLHSIRRGLRQGIDRGPRRISRRTKFVSTLCTTQRLLNFKSTRHSSETEVERRE